MEAVRVGFIVLSVHTVNPALITTVSHTSLYCPKMFNIVFFLLNVNCINKAGFVSFLSRGVQIKCTLQRVLTECLTKRLTSLIHRYATLWLPPFIPTDFYILYFSSV